MIGRRTISIIDSNGYMHSVLMSSFWIMKSMLSVESQFICGENCLKVRIVLNDNQLFKNNKL